MFRIMRIKTIILLIIIGTILVLLIPQKYEGPMLLYINKNHSIRLMDGLGLMLAIPAWFYLNLLLLRHITRKRKLNDENLPQSIDQKDKL